MHQPFVAPVEEDLPLLESDPRRVRATHYDLVINGVEIGSGSLRNHRADVQMRILELLGYTEERARERFGFLLNALETGALYPGSTSVTDWQDLLVCDDSSGGGCGLQAQVELSVETGEEYIIRIGGWLGEQGDGNIDVSCVASP